MMNFIFQAPCLYLEGSLNTVWGVVESNGVIRAYAGDCHPIALLQGEQVVELSDPNKVIGQLVD